MLDVTQQFSAVAAILNGITENPTLHEIVRIYAAG